VSGVRQELAKKRAYSRRAAKFGETGNLLFPIFPAVLFISFDPRFVAARDDSALQESEGAKRIAEFLLRFLCLFAAKR
jgi:hypothetical protein